MASLEPPQHTHGRPPERWRELLLVVACLGLAVVLGRWLLGPAPEPLQAPAASPGGTASDAASAPSGVGPRERATPQPRGALTVVARDWEREPVRDLELSVGPLAGHTDWQGEVRFEGLERGLQAVRLPEGWFGRIWAGDPQASSVEVDLQGSDQLVTLLVERDCPGSWHVLDPDGQPVAGAVVFGPGGPRVETDGRGLTDPVTRHCGANDVWVWLPRPDGHFDKYFDLTAEVAGVDPAELHLPPLRSAEIAVADPEGAPLDAEVGGLQQHRVTPLGEGLYEVFAPVEVLGCAVSAEGWSRREVVLPLDGRRVHVTLQPAGGIPVAPEDPDDGDASIVGRWTGRTPCSVTVGATQGACATDGTFAIEGLQPGDYVATVDDVTPEQSHVVGGEVQQATRRVHLGPGQRVDLGLVEPDAGCVEGRVLSEHSVAGLTLQVLDRRRQTTLGADGSFMLCELPLDEPVELALMVPAYFLATTEVLAGDDLTLRLSFLDDGTAALTPE